MATRKQANKTWEELENIRQELVNNIFPVVKSTKEQLDKYKKELLEGSEGNPSTKARIEELENKLVELKNKTEEQVIKLLEYGKTVFEDTPEQKSIKTRLESFLEDSEKIFNDAGDKKEAFDDFYIKVFGEEDEHGKTIGGLKAELEKYEVKYKKLYDKIEDLLPGATSAGLAKVFGDKVAEYAKSEKRWTILFLIVVFGLTVYYGILALVIPPSDSFSQSFLKLFHKTPFLTFAVWLLVFIGNRRAENKKLEESYKHKEVMARAYVGYKEHIEELEEETADKSLLKGHMDNLLKAINVNSSRFLSNEGDKHPFWDRFTGKKKIESNKDDSINEN